MNTNTYKRKPNRLNQEVEGDYHNVGDILISTQKQHFRANTSNLLDCISLEFGILFFLTFSAILQLICD